MGMLKRFWHWYEDNYALNVGIAAVLFTLQIVHLYWLTTDVVTARLWGLDLFPGNSPLVEWLLIIVDYTEIPAIITTSLVYINDLRQKFAWKSFTYLVFVDIQLLHIFWITDEFIVNEFFTGGTLLPVWLAWVAIFIDYLELPVIYETIKKFIQARRSGNMKEFLAEDLAH